MDWKGESLDKLEEFLHPIRKRLSRAELVAHFLPPSRRQAYVYDHAFLNEIEAVAYPYAQGFGRVPDFANPHCFAEKNRALQLMHPNPLMSLVADKSAVRKFFDYSGVETPSSKVIKVFDDPDQIEWSKLPDRWVLKVSDGSSMHLVHTPDDPTTERELRKAIKKWKSLDHWRRYAELHYKDLPRRYVLEEYLPSDKFGRECKLVCIHGEPYFISIFDRHKGERDCFDGEWKPQHIAMAGYPHPKHDTPRPEKFDQILADARLLARQFIHARIDFLEMNDRLILGEVTLTTHAMREPPVPARVFDDMGAMMDMSTLPKYLDHGRKVAKALGWPLETSWGHHAGDPLLATAGR